MSPHLYPGRNDQGKHLAILSERSPTTPISRETAGCRPPTPRKGRNDQAQHLNSNSQLAPPHHSHLKGDSGVSAPPPPKGEERPFSADPPLPSQGRRRGFAPPSSGRNDQAQHRARCKTLIASGRASWAIGEGGGCSSQDMQMAHSAVLVRASCVYGESSPLGVRRHLPPSGE